MTDPMLTPSIEKMRDELVLRIFTEFRHMSNRTPCDLTSVSLLVINSKLLYSFYFVVLETECSGTAFSSPPRFIFFNFFSCFPGFSYASMQCRSFP